MFGFPAVTEQSVLFRRQVSRAMNVPPKPIAPSPVASGQRSRRPPRKAKEKPAYSEVVDPATGSPTIKFTAVPNPLGK
jgi:hypothetical protein